LIMLRKLLETCLEEENNQMNREFLLSVSRLKRKLPQQNPPELGLFMLILCMWERSKTFERRGRKEITTWRIMILKMRLPKLRRANLLKLQLLQFMETADENPSILTRAAKKLASSKMRFILFNILFNFLTFSISWLHVRARKALKSKCHLCTFNFETDMQKVETLPPADFQVKISAYLEN
jgi:hypothetical protein